MPPENTIYHSKFKSLTLLAIDGSHLGLAEILGSTPTIIVFVRHFAVSQAAEHVPVLLKRIQELHGPRMKTIFIGAGSSQAMNNFRKNFSITYPIFRDQKLKTFKAMGLVESLRPEGIEEEFEIPVSGCIVVGQSGRILYFHKLPTERVAV